MIDDASKGVLHRTAPETPINPGVRKLVALLNANGFRTTDSGDGKTHDFECDRQFAYVCMTVPAHTLVDQARALLTLMNRHGVDLFPLEMESLTPSVQATYDPCNDVAILDLTGVDDSMLSEVSP